MSSNIMRRAINLIENVEAVQTFYHGTSKEKYQKIKVHGLDPNESQSYHNEEDPTTYDDDYEFEPNDGPHLTHFIYLAQSRATAQDYMDHHSDGIMLKITVPQSFADKFIYNRGEFIRSSIIIPPEYISIDHSFA